MRSWPKIVVHADMDAFYAAVEQLDDPTLRGRPVLVGPNSARGVVLTASYEARRYGVGSAMPMVVARRRCADAIIVPPHFERYETISRQVMDIFADFSPAVEPLSLDEAFLDMSGSEHLFGAPETMGHKIKAAVRTATGLNISVGISATKYVAKVASDHGKPNGLTVVHPDKAVAWLAPMPVNRLWGVGAKTARGLYARGLRTIGDIAVAEPRTLGQLLGSAGSHLYKLAHGMDPRPVSHGRRAQSIGSDRTLRIDIVAPADIALHLRRAADRVARRVRAKAYRARGIRVRLKTSKFEMLSRQLRLPVPADTADAFFTASLTLLDRFDHPGPFRLVGLAAFDLHRSHEEAQSDLFDSGGKRRLETTIDELITRFGGNVVMRASDLGERGTIADRGVNLDFLDDRGSEFRSSRS
jgi:DNA polymerase-4